MTAELKTGDFGMGMVTVNKKDLLETVKKNRDGHREAFLKAIEGFKKVAHAALNQLADDVVSGKSVQLHADLEVPQDHTDEYDTVIAQLERDVHEQVTVNSLQFNQFVLDKWGWSHQFQTTNAVYTKKA